jgi:hypothetical protein
MATKNTKKTDVVTPEAETEEVVVATAAQIPEDNSVTKMLMEQINLLKAEIAAMKSSTPSASPVGQDDEFNPNRLVIVRNMYNGFALSLKMDDHGGFRTMTRFGETMRIRLSEAENIVRLNRGFANKGYFTFDDKKISEYLGIDDINKKSVSVNFIQNLSDATPESIENAYKNANAHFRDLIMETFVNGHVAGEKTGFRDQSKMEALSRASGEDVSLRIRAVQETKQK